MPRARLQAADIVLDGAGVYAAASTPNLALRVRLASANVPGLPIVPMGVSLTRGPTDVSLWTLRIERARTAIPSEVLLAIVAREPVDGEVGAAWPLRRAVLGEKRAGTTQTDDGDERVIATRPVDPKAPARRRRRSPCP